MARISNRRKSDREEAIFKLCLGGSIVLAYLIGASAGVQTWAGFFTIWLGIILIGGAGAIGIKLLSSQFSWPAPSAVLQANIPLPPALPEVAVPKWNKETVIYELGEIDWYQFEKFCAALLESENCTVVRQGGAHPDGGVDLIAEKNGERGLIQCKHWRTWKIKTSTVREMLGSMTHFKVNRGAIYSLTRATQPAAALASEHAIKLVSQEELAERALNRLDPAHLTRLLSSREHYCPKCEAPMVRRERDFKSFWECSHFPKCRGKINQRGAR